LQIWREYDTDGSGYIEADELKVSMVMCLKVEQVYLYKTNDCLI